MAREPPDLSVLVGSWRAAFDSAQAALRAAERELTADEVRERMRRLADERAATVHVLEALAREHEATPLLARLVASPWETKRLLGLPRDALACVFNIDGVLLGSAAIHAEAWRQTFDEFVSRRIERTGMAIASFSVKVDYPRLVHGRSRVEAVRGFLASRGISLPEGTPDDLPGAETVHGLANRKNAVLRRRLEQGGIRPFAGARLYLELAHDAHVPCAVVSGSTNTERLLERAHLSELVDDRVDGNTMASEGLRRKPEPDALLAACQHLGVAPEHAVVFETTPDGVTAGRVGGFELVVAVDQGTDVRALRDRGADLVVSDLGDLLEHALAA
jgi:HAD superfamily hydrolase (TIGR01509 family)